MEFTLQLNERDTYKGLFLLVVVVVVVVVVSSY
jgi:hypothetical protein